MNPHCGTLFGSLAIFRVLRVIAFVVAALEGIDSPTPALAQFGTQGPSKFKEDPAFARPEELEITLTTDKAEYRPLEFVIFRVKVTNRGNRIVRTRSPNNYFGTTSVEVIRIEDDAAVDVPMTPITEGRGGNAETGTLHPEEFLETDFTMTGGYFSSIESNQSPGRFAARAIYVTGDWSGFTNDPPALAAYSNVVEYRLRPHTPEEDREYEEFVEARGDNYSRTAQEQIDHLSAYLEANPGSFYRRQAQRTLLYYYFSSKRKNEAAKLSAVMRQEPLSSEEIDGLWKLEAGVYEKNGEFERAYRLLESSGRKSFVIQWHRDAIQQRHGPFPDRPVAAVPPVATPSGTPAPTNLVAATVPSRSNSPAWKDWLIVLVAIAAIVGLAARSRRRAT